MAGTTSLTPPPEVSARRAGLYYVSDDQPGYARRRCGRGFTYLDPEGQTVKDPALRARFEALVIPPAWRDVWICAREDGHLQATGRDERGRKQYLYHPDWERARNETKFDRLVPFGEALPELRARCEHDLRRRGLPRDKVLATVVCLLDCTLIRIGNDAYARQNGTFGLTTLRDRHVKFEGRSRFVFAFKGKSGKEHEIELADRRLARIVRGCRDIPGYELFQYFDDDGAKCDVGSGDVNAYLRETTGLDLSAKDFRTWGGTVKGAIALAEHGPFDDEKTGEQNVVRMVKDVAQALGNTTTVCRKYYVHPAVIDGYLDGTFVERWPQLLQRDVPAHLEPEENAVLHLLRDR